MQQSGRRQFPDGAIVAFRTGSRYGRFVRTRAAGSGQRRAPLVLATALVAVVLAGCGGDDEAEAQDPAAVKSCLDDAGFDTAASTGLESAFFEGEAIEYRDEFAAQRDGAEFGLWFLNSEEDANGLAEVVKELGDPPPPPGQPRVEGTVVLGHDPEVDPQSLEAVEGCLGL